MYLIILDDIDTVIILFSFWHENYFAFVLVVIAH